MFVATWTNMLLLLPLFAFFPVFMALLAYSRFLLFLAIPAPITIGIFSYFWHRFFADWTHRHSLIFILLYCFDHRLFLSFILLICFDTPKTPATSDRQSKLFMFFAIFAVQ